MRGHKCATGSGAPANPPSGGSAGIKPYQQQVLAAFDALMHEDYKLFIDKKYRVEMAGRERI